MAILKRLRRLLLAQQEGFQWYLEVLDKQRDAIEQGNIEAVVAQVELEEKILGDMFAIQKVIDPLESLYGSTVVSKDPEAASLRAAYLEIKKVLEPLQIDMREGLERNKELLSKRMTLMKADIQALRGSPLGKRLAVYPNPGTPSFIDLTV